MTYDRNADPEKDEGDHMDHFHDLMRYIIEHTNSAVAVHDTDLRYIYVSQRYLDQFGLKDRDIIGKHHYDVFPDLPQKWKDVHQRVLKGEVVGADRDDYKRDDGSVHWTRWECRPWYERDGSIGGIIVYTEVITEQVKAEEELRKLKDNLEAEVETKTREMKEQLIELERFHDATVEREFRMKELRDEISSLKSEIENLKNH
ncbi:MAG: PAS domain-containing protein [Bacteroidales bacterium]